MMSARGSDGSLIRAARARELKASAPAAAELLEFYAALVEYQQRLIDQREGSADGTASACIVSGFSGTSGSLLQAIDSEWVGRALRDFIPWLVRLQPDAAHVRDVAEAEWRELFESYRIDPDDASARFSETAVFALEAVLQPIAEHLAARLAGGANPSYSRGETDEARPTTSRCPTCGGAPVVGVLREEGHGARRRLVCGLCLTEWDYLRLVCVKCGEQRFEALPVFCAEQVPHARVEACDTCRSYLKTIDATKDGRVIPVVDDLATIPLDLWAREQGYTRVRASLFRT
jgi:FdhE protein